MKLRLMTIAVSAALFLAWQLPALADATSTPLCAPPSCFIMADGRYFRPASLGTTTVDATATAGTDQPVSFSLKEAILRGREMLNAQLAAANAKRKKLKTVPNQKAWVDVTLAIWNSASNDLRLVKIQKSGERVRQAADEGAPITMRFSNGVNSQFAVASAGQDVVVAVESPIFTEKWLSRRRKVYELREVVYTPYSDQLQTPEIVSWGKSSLDAVVAGVYGELRGKGTPSRAFPGRLLTDVIDPNLVKAVIMIEHLGPRVLLDGDAVPAVESVYAVYALNQADAYAYSRSTAGAKGLVQFIPSTYKLMTRRSELGLIRNFDAAMADPANAIKAEAAYLDSELAALPPSARDLYGADPARVDEYLAASYNGGSARVSKAIAAWGDGWSEDHSGKIAQLTTARRQLVSKVKLLGRQIKKEAKLKARKKMKNDQYLAQKQLDADIARLALLKKAALRVETVEYIKKLRAVMAVLKPSPTLALASTH